MTTEPTGTARTLPAVSVAQIEAMVRWSAGGQRPTVAAMPDHETQPGRFFRDDKGRVVLWQTPNIPIVGWALFSALAYVLPAGHWKVLADYLAFGFLFTWAFLEVT